MESNEQAELTSKPDTDSESRMTAKGGEPVGGGGIEQKGKRTHGHGEQCGGFLGKDIRRLNGNGKKYSKKKKSKSTVQKKKKQA